MNIQSYFVISTYWDKATPQELPHSGVKWLKIHTAKNA
jgi:hypothetical protein